MRLLGSRRVMIASLVALLLGIAGGVGTYAAYSNTAKSNANSFGAGTVNLSDNATGLLVTLSSAKPGDSSTGCIKVSYSGSLNANVHLYTASVTGSLASYVSLTVTRGTLPGSAFNCSGFNPDGTNYIGAGAGVIYSGTLAAYPNTYGGGIVDPTSGSPATWTTGTAVAYQVTVTLNNNAAAQGLSSNATFTWEARNL